MKRFLIARLSAMGDVVCTLPAAVALKRQFPESEIVWAVDPRFSAIARRCSAVDTVVEVKPSFHPRTWPRFEGEFDAAFDLQGLTKSGLCLVHAKAKQKLAYHWCREAARFFSQPVLPDPTSLHIVDQYVDVVRAFGVEADQAEFGLRPTEEDLSSAAELLRTTESFVILNGGAGWVTKRWAPQSFGKLADFLKTRGQTAVLIGGRAPADLAVADEIVASTKAPILNLVGKTSMGALVALIYRAKAHVGGDTGSTHIAAALGVPAVGLYGLTRPQRSCPYGQIDRCIHNPAGLSRIGVDDVIVKVEEAIA